MWSWPRKWPATYRASSRALDANLRGGDGRTRNLNQMTRARLFSAKRRCRTCQVELRCVRRCAMGCAGRKLGALGGGCVAAKAHRRPLSQSGRYSRPPAGKQEPSSRAGGWEKQISGGARDARARWHQEGRVGGVFPESILKWPRYGGTGMLSSCRACGKRQRPPEVASGARVPHETFSWLTR